MWLAVPVFAVALWAVMAVMLWRNERDDQADEPEPVDFARCVGRLLEEDC